MKPKLMLMQTCWEQGKVLGLDVHVGLNQMDQMSDKTISDGLTVKK